MERCSIGCARVGDAFALMLAVVFLAVGCGGSRPAAATTPAAKLPRVLARAWAARADAIAAAAYAGDGCRAEALAASLRDDVVSAVGHVPAAFRTILLVSVNGLANRIACTPPPKTVTAPPATLQQPPHDHEHPAPHQHDHEGDHGGNDN